MTSRPLVDRPLLYSIIVLTAAGFFMFLSASTGLLARNEGASFSSVLFNQAFLGLVPGLAAMYFLSRFNYKSYRQMSIYLLAFAVILTALVFVPHIGFAHGGAHRWISIGPKTFQPSEFLKIAVILYFAAWLSAGRDRAVSLKWGILPFLILIGVVGGLLLMQPDVDTFLVIFASCMAMLFAAGAKIRHMLLIVLLGVAIVGVMVMIKPYLLSRVVTYFNPEGDSLGASYQIQQSLIAVGSGKLVGRGFGQSIQKFSYLPEAIGDSIFAVESEEFGFLGSVGLILMFLLFASRSLYISSRSPDLFGKFIIVGIVVMIISQSFVNIGAMLNILPLSGIPLAFVSHGGTALFFTLAESGILLNISRSVNLA